MDLKQSEIIEKYQELKLQNDDVEEDDLLDLLDEDDSALQQYREARIQQLSKEFRSIKDAQDGHFGQIEEMQDEKILMETVAKTDFAVVHFYQPGFSKCKIMNERLQLLAEKHLYLKIFSVEAQLAPFLVTKLKIKVLPFVVIYKDGKELDRLVGFERLGNNPETFNYEALETLLIRLGVINRKTINYKSTKIINDDSDSELDI